MYRLNRICFLLLIGHILIGMNHEIQYGSLYRYSLDRNSLKAGAAADDLESYSQKGGGPFYKFHATNALFCTQATFIDIF